MRFAYDAGMKSFEDIFVAFGGPTKVGRALGVRTEHAGSMRSRGAIHPRHWPRLIAAAKERGIEGVTYETLGEMFAAARPTPPAPPAQPSEAVA